MTTSTNLLPSLIVIEATSHETPDSLGEQLAQEEYKVATSVLGLIDSLTKGRKVVWVERGEKLHEHISLLIKSYASGLITFMNDGKAVSFRFNPHECSLTVVITRSALESSYESLLAYVGTVHSK